MNSKHVIWAGLAIALAAGVFMWSRGNASQNDSEETSASQRKTSLPTPQRMGTPAATPVEREGDTPPPPTRMKSNTGEAGEPLTYVRDDGTVVRDHRANPAKPDYERVPVLPASISKVKPLTVAAVRQNIRPAMSACISAHKEAADSDAKAQAVMKISVENETLRIDEVDIQTQGVEDHDAFTACVSDAVLGHEQAVEGSEDVKSHTLTFPYEFAKTR